MAVVGSLLLRRSSRSLKITPLWARANRLSPAFPAKGWLFWFLLALPWVVIRVWPMMYRASSGMRYFIRLAGLGAFWMWSLPSWKKAMPVASVPRTSAAFPSSRMICRRWEGASFPL